MLSDNEKMARLIDNLYILTGVRANVTDTEGRYLCKATRGTRFCRQIQSTPEGLERCRSCDRQAMLQCRGREDAYFYRCHAGLCEAVQPIRAQGRTMGYLLFGEYLDHSGREGQWEQVLRSLDWYQGSRMALRAAFDELDQYSTEKIQAYLEIVDALETYTYMSGLLFSSKYTDQQKLERYLEEHYTEKLTLDSIARDLHMGRTKLCTLARAMPGGHTISQLLTHRRVREACTLLLRTNLPISEVSEAVGISDYNYFTKVFRQTTGLTPTAYRRTGGGK